MAGSNPLSYSSTSMMVTTPRGTRFCSMESLTNRLAEWYSRIGPEAVKRFRESPFAMLTSEGPLEKEKVLETFGHYCREWKLF